MPFDGIGNYTPPAGSSAVQDNFISPSAFNLLIDDIAAALSKMFAKDGQSTPSGNLSLGNNRIILLGLATALTDAMSVLSHVRQIGVYCAASGTNTITLTPATPWTSYTDGQMVVFIAAGSNTGAVTLNVSGLGAVSLQKNGSSALASGDIPAAGALVLAVYSGGTFKTKI